MKYAAHTRYLMSFRAGEEGYSAPRIRGTVRVFYDNKLDIFKFPPNPDRRAVKIALLKMYGPDEKLTGTWPNFRIEG